jgi:hypothetical protein
MRVLIDHELERRTPIKRLLQWGYGSGHSELSRAV